MSLIYSCRSCKRPLQATEGCGVCRDFKRQVIVTGEVEVSPFTVVLKNMRLLDAQLEAYAKEEKTGTPETRELARGAVRQAGAKVAVLADSYRKLAADRQGAVAALTTEEQQTLFVSWYRGLTPGMRKKLLGLLETAEVELNQPGSTWQNPFEVQ